MSVTHRESHERSDRKMKAKLRESISSYASSHHSSKRSTTVSVAKILALNKLLADKRHSDNLKLVVSDRSIYDDLEMVFTPPKIDRRLLPKFEHTYRMTPDITPKYKFCNRVSFNTKSPKVPADRVSSDNPLPPSQFFRLDSKMVEIPKKILSNPGER